MIRKPGWRTLEQRRTDSRLVLFYKIVYGYVTIPLPLYVIPVSPVLPVAPTHWLTDKYLPGQITTNTHLPSLNRSVE